MDAVKHTPGPWETERGVYIAGCGDHYEVTANYGAILIAMPPCEADARLIAAAPDLLAALLALTSDGSGAAMHAECWEKVRAAIAKVKGGA